MSPQFPLKIYLPRTTDDVVRVLKEVKQLGETLVVRSKGHSSNDLVLAGGGSMLVTEKLSGSIELDESAMTVKVQGGQISAELDEWLAARGLGLPIIGDHNHITVGGFASVGGISGASHWQGLFVDNVVALELVDWDGNVVECSETDRPELFRAVLLGLGRLGVIATLTLKVIKAEKYTTYWQNDQDHFRSLDDFLSATQPVMERPPADANMMRALYADLPMNEGKRFGIGMLSLYRDTDASAYARARNAMAYGPLHRIGWVSGSLPGEVDKAMKMAGFASVLFSPKYATIKNVESFPTRSSTPWWESRPAPRGAVARRARRRPQPPALRPAGRLSRAHQCLTVVALHVKGIRSAYLGHGDPDARFCEVLFDVGIEPEKLPTSCWTSSSRSSTTSASSTAPGVTCTAGRPHPEQRRAVDPNTFYADQLGEHDDSVIPDRRRRGARGQPT